MIALILGSIIAILGVIIAILIRLLRMYKRLSKSLSPATPSASPEELASLRETNAELVNRLSVQETRHQEELQRIIATAERELATRVDTARAQFEAEFQERKRTDRQVSNALSRGALLAKVAEHLGPMLPGFPYNLKECRHIGELFDYLIFENLETDPNDLSIVFLEIKTSSTGRTRRVTNPRERALRQAIRAGRVRYEVWQPPSATKLAELTTAAIAEIEAGNS